MKPRTNGGVEEWIRRESNPLDFCPKRPILAAFSLFPPRHVSVSESPYSCGLSKRSDKNMTQNMTQKKDGLGN